MIDKIRFLDGLYDYVKQTGASQVLRSRTFKLGSKADQHAYQHLINNFRKWIYYSKAYTFDKVSVNQVFFDFERMLTEYSITYGIKSGAEMINEGSLKSSSSKNVKSLEKFIEESLENVNKFAENTIDTNYSTFINEVAANWSRSFVINCIPTILNGNYVNVPVEYVVDECISDGNVPEFSNNEDYFFRYLNRLPIKINRMRIANQDVYNIVNISIVPLFISTGVDYYLVKDER